MTETSCYVSIFYFDKKNLQSIRIGSNYRLTYNLIIITRKMAPIKKRASSFPIIVCHHALLTLIFAVICSNFAFLSLLGSMTEFYGNGLARMDLKADTMVTIPVDLNTGWYAHDFL